MRKLLVSAVLGFVAVVGIAVAVRPGDAQQQRQTPPALFDEARGPTLTRFASEAAFERYVRRLGQARQGTQFLVAAEPPAEAANAPADMMAFDVAEQPPNPEITNNQTIGVDEGGIVKQIGRFLVVLQDGRLFSADLGAGAGAPLRLADRIDVYRDQANAASWYDEMLVFGDRILVTAYNYQERASEITVIRMDRDGRLTREGRFLLSSNDYYSTENYATRIVGDNLVFYAPQALAAGPAGRFAWPRIRRAERDGEADAGEALIGPTDVYASPGRVNDAVLHTLSVCPLRGAMDCRTTAFIGAPMRELYVSTTDAFLWIGAPDGLPWSIDYANRRRQDCPSDQNWMSGDDQAAMLYRLPLDGGPVGAVAVDGVPADQFAFDSRDGRFRALLGRAPARCSRPGEARPLALLDIPLAAFDDSIRHVSDRSYASLPPIVAGELENRFIGQWLVYGGRTGESDNPHSGSGARAGSTLVAVPLARPGDAVRLALPHNALRIERAGGDAVVTGYRDVRGLSLSYVSLAGARPRLAATMLLPQRFESEGRSHAFNAWIRRDGSGLIGLPTTLRTARSGRGWSDSASSELSFIAVAPDKTLSHAGELVPRPREPGQSAPGGYRCEISCVDWYGNSRPIFTGGRIFALMGTDLVEGSLTRDRIGEVGRLDLTGGVGTIMGRAR